ncbi:1,4-alpha-glucan branching protein [Blastococcus sp. HT6-30]|uniref:maltokinase N-terminal cap-like domain-containing protein n=1 Tax=Blastococcus sp. HT6-30 TaxID=3144843 RepID=UPI00321A1D71
MATIHRTTMVPTKLELLTAWLPRQPWYRPTGAPPALRRAGGFRLDDPTGEVGLEFVVVTDGPPGGETTYFVPLSYRGAPLAGAEESLVGTSEHGVLGLRWIYDAAADPVAIAQLLALARGAAQAQHQDDSDTLDPSVIRRWSGDDETRPAVELVRVLPEDGEAGSGIGSVEAGWTRADGRPARGTVVVVR